MQELFNRQGYIVLPQIIPIEAIDKCRDICMTIKKSIIENNLLDTSKNFGFQNYWRGVDMASFLSTDLFKYYTSDFMYNIATELLDTDEVHLFNDQIVVKLPHEDFEFEEHTDNQYGPNNELAKLNGFKTITCAWILDDFTHENGPISILNNETNQWDTPLPKRGDIVVWNGNTLHKSSINKTNKERVVWVCVYSTHDLKKIDSTKSELFKNSYSLFDLVKYDSRTNSIIFIIKNYTSIIAEMDDIIDNINNMKSK